MLSAVELKAAEVCCFGCFGKGTVHALTFWLCFVVQVRGYLTDLQDILEWLEDKERTTQPIDSLPTKEDQAKQKLKEHLVSTAVRVCLADETAFAQTWLRISIHCVVTMSKIIWTRKFSFLGKS